MNTWIPALTTTSILAVAIWLAKNALLTRLRASVEHEFNEKLERVRAEQRRQEQELQAYFTANELEVTSLREGALTAMSGRQAALGKRKLEAADQLWGTVLSMAPARSIAVTLSVMNLKKVNELAQKDEKMRNVLEAIGAGFDSKSVNFDGGNRARPYVSSMVWAVYTAMAAVVGHATVQWQAMKNGIDAKGLVSDDALAGLINAVLPGKEEILRGQGATAAYQLINELEVLLVAEIKKMLNGAEDDEAAVARAADIVRHATKTKASLVAIPAETPSGAL